MLMGDETVENASKYAADKMFFATSGISSDGKLYGGTYDFLHKTMANNSDKVIFLTDSGKINRKTNKILFDLEKVTHIISDYEFDQEVKHKYKNVEYIKV